MINNFDDIIWKGDFVDFLVGMFLGNFLIEFVYNITGFALLFSSFLVLLRGNYVISLFQMVIGIGYIINEKIRKLFWILFLILSIINLYKISNF